MTTETQTKTIKVRFYGIDSWNRPVFKQTDTKQFFGNVGCLFDYDATAEQVEEAFIGNEQYLYYFGNHFDCEPNGIHPSRLKKPLKLEIERVGK